MCIAQLEYYYINTYINIPKLLLETDIWTLNYMYIAEVCCIREAMGNMFPMLICLDRGDIGCQQIKIGNFHSSLSPPPHVSLSNSAHSCPIFRSMANLLRSSRVKGIKIKLF